MTSDDSEDGFIRGLLLLFLTTVMCPTKYNYANWKFLYGLHDISKISSYDLASLCIDHLMGEIVNHHDKLCDMISSSNQSDQMFVGGCLPLIAILYADFLDLNIARCKHNIDYRVPRIAHIKNEDFTFICYVDLKRDYEKLLKFGALPFRDISETPYSTRALFLTEEKWLKRAASVDQIRAASVDQITSESNSSASKERVKQLVSEVVSKHENLWRIAHENHVAGMLPEVGTMLSACFAESSESAKIPGDKVNGALVNGAIAPPVNGSISPPVNGDTGQLQL